VSSATGSLKEWSAQIRAFLREGLWDVEPERRSRLSALRTLQFAIMVVEGFVRDHLLLRASALTYFTVLSVVPLLAVAVSIVNAVGVGSTTFVDWVVGTVAAGSPEAQRYIEPLVEGADFGSLGTVGGAVLFVTTVLAIGQVESTLNQIWGVSSGRGWARRFSDYLAVLVVGPLLGGVALSLSATLRTQWAVEQLSEVPGFALLQSFGLALAPALMLSLAFTFLYWFLPNTRVRLGSAAIGGVVAGVLVFIAQGVYVDFSVGATRANAFFGSFALLPLLFVWIYVFWSIALLGSEVAFAHQNFTLYREEVRGRRAGPAEREGIALRIALEVARRFRKGGEALDASELALAIQVPVRTVRSVTTALLEAGIVTTRVRRDADDALQLGRPADAITVSEILEALRGGRQAHGERPAAGLVEQVLGDIDAAAREAGGSRTLADLLQDLPTPDGVAADEGRG